MKKHLFLWLTISLFFGIAIPHVLAVGDIIAPLPPSFSDVPVSNPHYQAIEYLKSHNIISGYPDGTFRPQQTVNRVKALKFILLGAEIPVDQSMKMLTVKPAPSDVQNGQWYIPYLNKAIELQIVQGYPDGTFKPIQTVNLVENLKMLVLAKKIDLSKIKVAENPYADAFINQWYTPYVEYAKDHRLIDADAQNKIYPSKGMTRADLAETMYRLMTLEQTTPPPSPTPPSPSSNLYDLSGLVLMINIQNSAFSKNSMTVGTGSTVKWTNMDNMPHTITSDDGKFSSGNIAPGGSFSFSFKDVGTYNYHCSIHTNMKGTIIVKPAIEVPTI